MSTHHGKPGVYLPCTQCGRPFKVHHCERKRRRHMFCSKACVVANLKAFRDHCDRLVAEKSQLAA